MDIVIHYKDAKSFLIRSETTWALAMKNSYRAIAILLLLGVGILLLGLLSPYTFQHIRENENTYYNFHISLAVGGGFIFVSLFYFYAIWKNKKIFHAATHSFIQRAEVSNKIEATIHLTSELIRFSTFEECNEVKWSVFIFYEIYNGHIALFRQSNIPSYLIELGKLSQEDKTTLLLFLEKTLVKK